MRKYLRLRYLASLMLLVALIACNLSPRPSRVAQSDDTVEVLDTPALPQVSTGLATAADDERDIITASNHQMLWAYYTDINEDGDNEQPFGRFHHWYISDVVGDGDKPVYALTPIKQSQAGWARLGEQLASVSLNMFGGGVQVADIEPSDSNRYYDAGWEEWVEDDRIHSFREKISGQDVPIAWYFFYVEATESWYIVNVPDYGEQTLVYRMGLKVEAGTEDYDWTLVSGFENYERHFMVSETGISVTFTAPGERVVTDIEAAFEDDTLVELIRFTLDIDGIQPLDAEQVSQITELDCNGCDIGETVGLEALQGVETLSLSHNNIDDLSFLVALPNVTSLNLRSNKISDVTPIVTMLNNRASLQGVSTQQTTSDPIVIDVAANCIQDFSGLEGKDDIILIGKDEQRDDCEDFSAFPRMRQFSYDAEGLDVNFMYRFVGEQSCEIDFGDGRRERLDCRDSVSTSTIEHTYSSGGNYDVRFILDGKTATFGITVDGAQPQPAMGSTIASGEEHSLAITADGNAWAWGQEGRGQLGIRPDFINLFGYPTPRPVNTNLTFRQIAAGEEHSLGITSNGNLLAWGHNYNGQLGDGTNSNSDRPRGIGLTNVHQIAAGGDHSLALTADGQVWAWGDNRNGQVGNGTTTDSNVPVRVLGLSNVWQIAAGGDASFAITDDGSLWAWGGDSRTVTPEQVQEINNVKQIATGGSHHLAITDDGSLWAWGRGSEGQLGNGTTSSSRTPVRVTGLSNVQQVAAGHRYSFATTIDGNLWAWGDNFSGQLGIGSTASLNDPPIDTPMRVIGLNNVQQITAANAGSGVDFHALALTADGSLWAWGSNSGGVLGNDTFSDSDSPVRVLIDSVMQSP